jgi:3',5'-cyclic AMP phosphodiesterase CpdA
MNTLSRRDALRAAGAAGLLASLGGCAAGRSGPAGASSARVGKPLRIVHMTDTHIFPGRGAEQGVANCLNHAAEHARPDLVLTGGDLINDGFGAEEARVKAQWDLFVKAFADHCPAPALHTLGNHDIWGWNKGKSATTGAERLWGKTWAIETLGLSGRYNASTHGVWKIIRLDSVQIDPDDANGYIGKVDDEQWDWLERELASTPAGHHVLVCSHIPVHTATSLFGRVEPNGKRLMLGGIMHTDNARLIELFTRYPAVKACVSGHTHRVEHIDFRGVQYLCNGAVSGAWWNGPHHEAFEGYAVLDLFPDGRIEHSYQGYGWVARKE